MMRHDHDDHGVAERRGVSELAVAEGALVGEEHGELRRAPGAALGEDVHEAERVEVPDEVERRDGDGDGPQCRPGHRAEPLPPVRAVEGGGLVELVRRVLETGEQRDGRLRHARPDSDDDDRRQSQLEAAQPVDVGVDDPESLEDGVEDAGVGVVDELPEDRDDDRRHGPRHQRQGADKPLEPQTRVEQQGQPEGQDELEDRHREGPDETDLERVPEDVVLQQPDVVVEPVEVVVHLVAGLGVGEAQPDPVEQRVDAEQHDRHQARQEQEPERSTVRCGLGRRPLGWTRTGGLWSLGHRSHAFPSRHRRRLL